MSDSDYVMWKDLVQERTGLFIPQSRIRTLRHALWQRIRAVQSANYGDYYNTVAFGDEDRGEWTQLLELLVNPETSFFRHQPSYTALIEHALPDIMRTKQKSDQKIIRLWSVACSGGQETYSLAMAFLSHADPFLFDLVVTGSDISQNALSRANRGTYRQHELRFLSDAYRDMFLEEIEDNDQPAWKVTKRVRDHVRFTQINLSDFKQTWNEPQDVIFCQNVLIYFDLSTRRKIVTRLCDYLEPGGYLFLAPAEVVGLEMSGMEPIQADECVIYKRQLEN